MGVDSLVIDTDAFVGMARRIGGVYVQFLGYGYRLTAHKISKLFTSASELRVAVEELDTIDCSEELSLKTRIARMKEVEK
jgi:hypothetical protein